MKGNLTRRGKASWRLKFDIGVDPVTGRRITKFVTLRGTKAQAQAEATRILAGVISGTHVDPSTETVAAFVERWLRDWADDNVSNKTWTRYAQLLRKHLCRRLGAVPIQKLRAADLQAVYAAMAQDGLADRTRLHLHRVVHTMLKHAVQWGVVSRNVTTMVDAPRVKGKEIEILSPAQVSTVLETLRGRSLYPIVAVALGTGLRRSELLALRWKDVDLDKTILRVEQALEQNQAGRARLPATQDTVRAADGHAGAIHGRSAARAPQGAGRAAVDTRARQGAGRCVGVCHLGWLNPIPQCADQGVGAGHETRRSHRNAAQPAPHSCQHANSLGARRAHGLSPPWPWLTINHTRHLRSLVQTG
jgi:integrase